MKIMINNNVSEIRIYIIGDVEQAERITQACIKIKDLFSNSIIAIKTAYKNWSTLDTSEFVFNAIDICDVIYVVTKPDGTVDEVTAYEIEYAKRIKKLIMYSSPCH